MSLLDILLTFLSLATCLRLLFYRRGKSAFKASYSFVAYLFIVSYGALGLALLTGIYNSLQLNNLLIVLLTLLSFLLFYWQGNVARLIKLQWRIL